MKIAFGNKEYWVENTSHRQILTNLFSGKINVLNKILDVETFDEWNYTDQHLSYYRFIFLINKEIIAIIDGGTLKVSYLPEEYVIYDKVLRYSGKEKLYHISDMSGISSIPISVVKSIETHYDSFKNNFHFTLMVLPKVYRYLFAFYQMVSKEDKQVSSIKTFELAIEHILLNQQPVQEPVFEPEITEKSALELFTKEELIQKYLDREKEYERAFTHLLKKFATLTYGEKYDENIEKFNVSQNLTTLIEATELLQKDWVQMLEIQKAASEKLSIKLEDVNKENILTHNRLIAIIENAPYLIFAVDRNFNLIITNKLFNQFFSKRFRHTPQAGENFHRYIAHFKQNEWQSILEEVLSGKVFKTIETIKFDQNKLDFKITCSPIYQQNQIDGMLVFAQDITIQNILNERLTASEEKYRSLFEDAPFGIVLVDYDDYVIDFNRFVTEKYGIPKEKGIGLSIYLFSDPDRIEEIKNFNKLLKNKIIPYYQYEQKAILPTGNRIWVKTTNCAIYDSTGKFMYRLLFIEDIHEKKVSELELKQKSDELIETNRQLDRFVYSVSHDLRAPLTSVLGLVHLMKKENLSPEIMHYIDLEEKLLNRLDSFIKDLIDYSRNARLNVEKTEVNLEQMIKNMLEQYSFLENFNQLRVTCDFKNGSRFLLDESRINVVLNNLISNAIRYSDVSKNPFLKIMVETENNQLKMTFEDNGIGIDENHIDKIFGMFYRANKIKSGSGLGLFIVKESIEKLGGSITVDSTLGEGTTFTVIVPLT